MSDSDFSFDGLIGSIEEADVCFRSSAFHAVNVSLTLRNWCIGAYISEFELRGENRARYGDKLYERISRELSGAGLKRCEKRELLRYVLFYERYPDVGKVLPSDVKKEYLSICVPTEEKRNALITGIWETLSPKFKVPIEKLISSLSFSHIVEIMQIDNPLKRAFYEVECINGAWSVRTLRRQIGSMYFERMGLSRDSDALSRLANEGAETMTPALAVRDPYVFEFLGLSSRDLVSENDLESGLLQRLEDFMLELGNGFCFEARQKRMLIGDEFFTVDLVFYHRILRCHVLVDLKMDWFSYADAGQMNMYLNWFRENVSVEGDNPPVGILLCPSKSDEAVRYATGGLSNEVFVSKYEVELPSVSVLERFIEREVRILKEELAEYRKDNSL